MNQLEVPNINLQHLYMKIPLLSAFLLVGFHYNSNIDLDKSIEEKSCIFTRLTKSWLSPIFQLDPLKFSLDQLPTLSHDHLTTNIVDRYNDIKTGK